MANRFLSNIKINDAYTFPASDGSNGQVIVTDGAGNLTFANPATSSSASIIYRDNFTGDGSTTVFYLQNSLSDEDQTQIYIDGVYQEKGTYSLSNNAITFTTAPPNGDSVEVISISGINVGPTTIYQDNFTGDGTTTDFTLAQAVNDEVKTMVYFNGVYQFKGTYSLNGTLMSFEGLASQDLAQGEFGYVTEFGKIIEIDTSGYTAGDVLWFDAGGSTAGALTTTEPAAPLAKIQVAAVIRSHQTEGVLFIRPTWYHELGELHDVNITSVADKDLLVWNDTAGYWENSKTVDTLTGNTLSATTLTGTLSTAAQTNITSLGTLSSLGLSGDITSTGRATFSDIVKSQNSEGTIFTYLDENGIYTSNTDLYLYAPSGKFTSIYSGGSEALRLQYHTFDNAGKVSVIGAYPLVFDTNGSERMRIDSSGRVGINVTPSLSNVRLHTYNNSTDAYNIFESSANKWVFGEAGGVCQVGGRYGAHTGINIDTAGKAAIGTTSPAFLLHIGATLGGSPLKYLNGTSNTFSSEGIVVVGDNDATNTSIDNGLFLANNSSQNGAYSPIISFAARSASAGYNHAYASIYGIKTNSGADSNWNRGDLIFATSNGTGPRETMRITSAGDIILKDYANIFASTNNSTVNSGIYYGGSDNTLRLYTNNSERARITSAGSVLINTTTAS